MSNPPVVETDATGGFGAASYERPVPRISIDAFCEFPDTLSELEHAAADRRLSKAHVNVQSGGVVGAVKFFADHPTPNLIIVETRGQGEEVIAELEQLATVCDETTRSWWSDGSTSQLYASDPPRVYEISSRRSTRCRSSRPSKILRQRESPRSAVWSCSPAPAAAWGHPRSLQVAVHRRRLKIDTPSAIRPRLRTVD